MTSAPNMSFDHVGISVRDLASAAQFYAEALGLREEFRFAVEEDGLSAVVLRHPDGFGLELLQRPDSSLGLQADDPHSAVLTQGYGHICLRVADLDAAHEKFLTYGAATVVPPSAAPHPSVRYAYMKDPEGNLVELIQRPDEL
jgi:catechol 2,3-dioxygenase-like lactoylglutathione lyase family enzyme